MEHYINKDALVLEINRRIEENKADIQRAIHKHLEEYFEGYEDALVLLKEKFIDILEVKEVNLEEEIKSFTMSKELYESDSVIKTVAKHFFELGLQARIDKELVEEIHSHIDSIKDTADRMTSGNFMHNKAAIKFSANTITKVLELMGLKSQKGE